MAAEGTLVGKGYVDVVPDFSGFQERVGRELAKKLGPDIDRIGKQLGLRLGKNIGRGTGDEADDSLKRSLAPAAQRFERLGRDAGRALKKGLRKERLSDDDDILGLNVVHEHFARMQKEFGPSRFKRITRGIRGELRGITKDATHAGRRIRNAFGRLRVSMGRVNTIFRFFGNILRTIKWPLVVAGIGLVAQGLSALTAGIVATTSALGPLTGALVALPAAALTAAQAFGTLKLATAGVGDAIKAALDVQIEGGEQAQDVMRGQEDAAERVADAYRSLADTERQAAIATEDLTEAREEARRQLQDLRMEAEGLGDAEQGAVLSLKQARRELQETYRDLSASGLDVRFAEEAVDQAEADLKRTRTEAKRTRADFQDAQRKGVEGMPQVVAAKRSQADATRAVEDAERELGKAVRDNTVALEEQGSAATALQQKLSQLPPAARAFVREIVALKPKLDELRATAASGLFPGVTKGLRAALKNFGPLKGIVGETAQALGNLATKAGRKLGSAEWGKDLSRLGKLGTRSLNRMGEAGLHLADAFRHIMVAAEPFLDWLGESTEAWAEWIAEESEAGRRTGALAEFFEHTREAMELLKPVLKGVSGALVNIGEVARPFGNQILKSLGDAAEGWREWTDSTKGRNRLKDYFRETKPAIFEMGRLLRDIGHAFFELGRQRGVAHLLRMVRVHLIPALVDMTGAMTGFFSDFLKGFGELRKDGVPAFEAFLRVLLEHSFEAGKNIAEAFVNAWWDASIWGKVAGAALILRIFGGLGAVTKFGLRMGWKFGKSFATSAASWIAGTELGASLISSFQGVFGRGGKFGTLMGRLGKGAAKPLAFALGRALPVALGALGIANIVTNATQGDWKKAGFEAGGALAGGIAGAFIGGPFGAIAGAGVGSLLGGALSGLFSTSKKLRPVQERIESLAKRSAQAMRSQARATDAVAAAQRRLRGANKRSKNANEAVAKAQREHTAAVRQFGPESLPALRTSLRLSRVQQREAKAAEEAKEAHRLSGLQLQIYKSQAVEAVHIEVERIPLLRKTVDRLRKQWEGEKNNVPLRERLSEKLNELTESERRRNRTIKEAAQVAGPQFARSLERQTVAQARFGKHLKGIDRKQRSLKTTSRIVTDDITQDWGARGALSQAIRKFHGQTATEIARGASGNLKEFSRKGSRSFRSLAGAVYQAEKNIFSNTAGSLKALGAAKIPKFQLQKLGGGESQRKQRGGLVSTPQLANGGLAAEVPGHSTGDRHVLSLNGNPIAKVESKEGIFVGNRKMMAAAKEENDRHPRFGLPKFATGGGFGDIDGLASGAKNLAKNIVNRFGGVVSSGLRSGDSGSLHSTGKAFDWIGGDWAGAASYMNSIGPSLLEGIYNGALGGPPVSWDSGKKVPSSFWGSGTWAGHGDHLHGAVGGIVTAAIKKIERLMLQGPAGPLKDLGQSAIDKVWKAANEKISRLASSSLGMETSGLTATGNGADLMRQISKQRGWNFADWWELDRRETGHGADLLNESSGAALRGQFMPGITQGNYGPGSDPSQNPTMAQQIIAMAEYIKERYGNPSAALAHHDSHNWYQRGGLVDIPGLPGLISGGMANLSAKGKGKGKGRRKYQPMQRQMERLTRYGLSDRVIEGFNALKQRLTGHSDRAEQFSEWASNASALTTEGPDGETIQGEFQGGTEGDWLLKQVKELGSLRNSLIAAQERFEAIKQRVQEMIEQAKKQVRDLKAQIKRAQARRRKIIGKIADARGTIGKARDNIEKAQGVARDSRNLPPAQRRRRIERARGTIDAMRERISDARERITGFGRRLGNIDFAQSQRRGLVSWIQGRTMPKLEDRFQGVKTALEATTSGGEGFLGLKQVQGLGGPMHSIDSYGATQPPIGTLGGEIFNAQSRLKQIGEQASVSADDGDESEKTGLLEDLLRQANQRTAVEARLGETLEGFDASYPRFFEEGLTKAHTGGEIIGPGPRNSEVPIMAQVGETMLTKQEREALEADSSGGPGGVVIEQLTIHEDDSASIRIGGREFDTAVEKVVRKTTGVGRKTPGGTRI